MNAHAPPTENGPRVAANIPAAFKELFYPARNKAFFGGRGGAKSRSFATALLLKGAKRPLRILCAREIQKSIRDSVKRLLDDEITRLGITTPGGVPFYTSIDTEIRGANGTLFLFTGLHNNPDTIKSAEGIDIAWVEEAHRVSARSIELLRPTLRSDDSELWWSWNPESPEDPVDAMFRGKLGAPPRSIVRQVGFLDNPWFPKVLREELEWDRKRDPDKYDHVWGGGYRKMSQARVFKNYKIEYFEDPIGRILYGGDWGFADDPSVVVRSILVGRTLYITHEAYGYGVEIDHLPALFAGTDKLNPPRWTNVLGHPGIPGALDYPIIADSARPETISYMNRHGFKIRPARKGPGSVEEGVEFLKSCDIVIHPRCRRTAYEFSMYSYKVDKQTELVLPVLDDRHNHGIDSVRYSLEQSRRPAGKIAVGKGLY